MFHFRLEKVLRHRRRIVDDEARKLQTIGAQIGRHLALKKRYETDITEVGSVAQESRAGSLDIRLECNTDAFIRGRRQMIDALEQDLQAVRKRFEDQRMVLIGAQRDVSVLERLEESQRTAWQQDERRREQKIIDEVAGRYRANMVWE